MSNYPTIQEQIEAVKKATENALKSKESAAQFLVDAGIIKEKEIKELDKNIR